MSPQPSQKLQTFRGRTANEARDLAVSTLGRDAVIIATRTVPRTTLASWFDSPQIEVTAKSPTEETDNRMTTHSTLMGKAPNARNPFSVDAYRENAKSAAPRDELEALRIELRREVRSIRGALVQSVQNVAPMPEHKESPRLQRDLAAIREMIEALGEANTPDKAKADGLSKLLRQCGIEGAAATAITRLVRTLRADPNGPKTDREALKAVLPRMFDLAPWPLQLKDGERAFIALVGPWGVGKTTTAAKLAARAILDHRKSVTLVAADTNRVGAIEQLRRYAELLQADFQVARTADEARQIVSSSKSDVVIFDTAGHGPGQEKSAESFVSDTTAIEAAGLTRHVLLCVSSSLRAVDAARVARTFAPLEPTELAMTKLDDTDVPAGIIHTVHATRLPISVLCFGQRVPEDIARAEEDRIVSSLLPQTTKRAS